MKNQKILDGALTRASVCCLGRPARFFLAPRKQGSFRQRPIAAGRVTRCSIPVWPRQIPRAAADWTPLGPLVMTRPIWTGAARIRRTVLVGRWVGRYVVCTVCRSVCILRVYVVGMGGILGRGEIPIGRVCPLIPLRWWSWGPAVEGVPSRVRRGEGGGESPRAVLCCTVTSL
jgi:hypothetical protein